MNKKEILHEVMTSTEVAEEFNVDCSTVRKWCLGQKGRSPKLPPGSFRRGKPGWLIIRSEVEKLLKKSGKDS